MSTVADLVTAAALAGVTDHKVFAALIEGAAAAAAAAKVATVEVAAPPAKPAGKIAKVAAKPVAKAAPVVVAVEVAAVVPDHKDAKPTEFIWGDDDTPAPRAAGGAGAKPTTYAAAAGAASDACSDAGSVGSTATIVVTAPTAKDHRRKKHVGKTAIVAYYKTATFYNMDDLWYKTQVETEDGWLSVFDIFVETLTVRFNFHGGIALMRKLGLAGPTEHVDFRNDPNGQAFRAAALEWLSETVGEYNVSRRLASSIVSANSSPKKCESGPKWMIWAGDAKKADGVSIDPKNGAITFVKL